jgi:vesicle coat complex subunit
MVITPNRLTRLIVCSLIGWTVLVVIAPGRVTKPIALGSLSVLAQSPTPNDLGSNTKPEPLSPEVRKQYNLTMQSGYGAAQSRRYAEARRFFQEALKLNPNDIYARQALFNIDTYQVINQQQFPPLWLLLLGIMVMMIALFGIFLLIFHQSQQHFLREVLERRQQLEPLQQSLQAGELKATANTTQSQTPAPLPLTPLMPSLSSEENNLPLQTTQRIRKTEFVEQLITDLSTTDARKRRKVIWELAQKGDSRAVKPLVDLMISTDSQERNLILEALSQISTRTLKPMNQALALSLQDKNPQVRKNAIRDLTRLYDLMSQISQQLSFAVHDHDSGVQETAQWAMDQLNLQNPSRLGMFNRSNLSTVDPSLSEGSEG